MTLAEITTQVEGLLQARGMVVQGVNAELAADDITQQIKSALRQYSQDAPDVRVATVTGDGSLRYSLSDLDGWERRVSHVCGIEYPVEQQPLSEYEGGFRDDYRLGDVDYLYFLGSAPSGEFRVSYTTRYVLDESDETTVPDVDRDAVAYWAAALCCTAIATRYSRTNDATLSADGIRHTTREQAFQKRAKEFKALYREAMGLDDDGDDDDAAGEWVDWDTMPTLPMGRRFLFHGERGR